MSGVVPQLHGFEPAPPPPRRVSRSERRSRQLEATRAFVLDGAPVAAGASTGAPRVGVGVRSAGACGEVDGSPDPARSPSGSASARAVAL